MCQGGVFQWVRNTPGDVVPAGSNLGSHGYNVLAEVFDSMPRF
jgi:hypothetical protein